MLSDSAIRGAFAAMVDSIEAPPVPMAAIDRCRALPGPRSEARFLRPAIAVAAALAIAASLPAVAPGLVQSAEQRIAQILGWTPPKVGPTSSLMSQLRRTPATLASARARVPFTLVAPTGLPGDAALASISIARSGIYTKATHTWSVGSNYVTFTYRRAHGRTFSLLADEYDPQTGPPGKYMFVEAGAGPGGQEKLVRRRQFQWRNGDQVIKATASDSLSAAEIEAIQKAMNGTPVPPAQSRAQRDSGTIDKLYAL
jgi:hypothetical protein